MKALDEGHVYNFNVNSIRIQIETGTGDEIDSNGNQFAMNL